MKEGLNIFNETKVKETKFNTKIALPNYSESWLDETDMDKILFLYTYLKSNQIYVDGHYVFNTNNYLHLLYMDNYVKNKWKELIDKLNETFNKLYVYKLINCDVTIKNKSDTINLNYSALNNQFEDGSYTLIDYYVLDKIFTANENIKKDKLLLCCFFLNNRARDNIGYTSFEDIGKVISSKTTISKYLNWLKDNEIFDYYSTKHKLDENGVPKRGNTVVARWENRKLIDSIRNSDKPSKNSTKDVNKLNERFKDDNYYCKLSKVLNKYGLTNNFLLLRLWNELPFGFTWEAIYKYLNNRNNFDFFNYEYEADNDDEEYLIGTVITNKTKKINKILNVAKKQKDFVLQYDDYTYNDIIMGVREDTLIGRIYENSKCKNIKICTSDEKVSESNSEYWGIHEEEQEVNTNCEMQMIVKDTENTIDCDIVENNISKNTPAQITKFHTKKDKKNLIQYDDYSSLTNEEFCEMLGI